MALSPELNEWLKEAQKPMSLDERAEADVRSMRANIGRGRRTIKLRDNPRASRCDVE